MEQGGTIVSNRRHVTVVPMGKVDELAISVVAANIQTFMGLMVDVVPPLPDPSYAILPGRGQYDAIPIMTSLRDRLGSDTLIMGIINGDLCLPILTYVFGEAQVNGWAAVVSLYRLGKDRNGGNAPLYLVLERLAKIAVHEMAHVLGLPHCRTPGCLMTFSLDLEQLDELHLQFCSQCRQIIQQRVLHPHGDGHGR